jgi:hypothetical protein
MIKIEQAIFISRPVEDVFRFAGFNYVQNHPRWSPSVTTFEQTSPGPMGVGTTVRQVRMQNDKPTEAITTFTEFVPNQKISFKAEGGASTQGTYVFEQAQGGTNLYFNLEMDDSSFGRLIRPIVGRKLKGEVEADLARIKQLVESSQ